MVQEDRRDGEPWLHVKDRPLDEPYCPHLPTRSRDQEGRQYWMVVRGHHTLPSFYHYWADTTIVGPGTGIGPNEQPRMQLVYARGW